MSRTAPGNGLPLLGFAPHLRVESTPGEPVFLMTEDRVTTLGGEQIALLAPLLDGSRDLPGIVADAAPRLSAERTERLVTRLLDAGLLCAYPPDGGDGPERAYWALTGLAVRPGHGRDAALAPVDLTADPGTPLAQAVSAAGLRTAVEGEAADLTLALCHDYLDPRLGDLDAKHRAAGRSWLPVRANGTHLWIGPFFSPGDGPCWNCLADRLRLRRRGEAYVQHRLGRGGPAAHRRSYLPAGRAAALHLALLEAGKWLAGHRDPAQNSLWRLDTRTLESSRHPVRRRPQCSRCGDPLLVHARVSAPVTLSPRPVRDTGGGQRTFGPDRLLERYGHLVDPVTGLVGEIRRDPRGPEFLNCFHAGAQPPWDPALPPPPLHTPLRSPGSGKGVTELHARASALAEALERYSGYFQGDEPRRRGSYRAFGPLAVHPDAVQLFDRRQFDDRETWNRAHGPFHQVPEPFDEDAPLDWTPVWSLTERRQRLAPTSLLYFNAPDADTGFCRATSNGAAAGTSLEDAVVHGCLELVERDAIALWWYNRTRQPGLPLDPQDPWIVQLLAVLRDMGRTVWALDLTSDLGIPVVAAVSARGNTNRSATNRSAADGSTGDGSARDGSTGDADGFAEDIVLGFGAHFDPRIALRRALTELNQMLPPLAEAPIGKASAYTGADPEARHWFRHATLADQPYLLPAARRPAPPPASLRPPADASAQVEALVALLRPRGLDVLVLDQTRPDVELPVAKVLIPGLRPHWAGFGPGRLFDVPVALGRLPRPTKYADLNPLPLPL
ncbi:TOMM precursor leader peptide-binding protein [Streptomyces sp. NBC_01275]|uniref:TOMM precursor leader peptide-binding protein n=1 Tax=Streptomyces sp. NBC_01275 TaxID=2903807 RepID=UPI002258E91A|nr:TOMM precursor leader peptide-binding protein [Streptomyces sp. NBC_01275]MCX4766656.1 TOMM precursor leader peptide-binding protein [Streptomyces sp. NBC_01275]